MRSGVRVVSGSTLVQGRKRLEWYETDPERLRDLGWIRSSRLVQVRTDRRGFTGERSLRDI